MLHGLTMFLGIVMWICILLFLLPRAYRFARTHKDSITEAVDGLRRLFERHMRPTDERGSSPRSEGERQ
jgi:hypothetical protein